MNHRIKDVIHQLIEIHRGQPWIGRSFDSVLNQIDSTSAFAMPIEGLHSVAEIVSHLTFWREETIRKMQTRQGTKTDDDEENWLSNKQLEAIGWPSIREAYFDTLCELIQLLRAKDDDFLDEQYYDADFEGYYSYQFVITGMLHHDIYHLGQLGIILKFLKETHKV